MSLRGFHIFFILVSILLALGFAFWAFNYYASTQVLGYFLTGFCSAMSAVGLALYLNSFIHKVKT